MAGSFLIPSNAASQPRWTRHEAVLENGRLKPSALAVIEIRSY